MNSKITKIMLLSVALSGTMVSCQKDSEMISSQETSILFFKIDCASYYKLNNQ